MARPGFYDTNSNRAYPFLKGETGEAAPSVNPGLLQYLPESAIVDCGFIAGLSSGYEAGTHKVCLVRVGRIGSQFEFEFRCDAPGLHGHPIVFCRDLDDDRYSTDYVESGFDASIAGEESSSSEGCPAEWSWMGYLVCGDLTDLAAILTGGNQLTGEPEIEPATVRSMAGGFVRAVSLANAARSKATSAEGCRELCWDYDEGATLINARCLSGSLKFKEGYNISIQQDSTNNSLTFNADVGAGEGEPCDEFPTSSVEAPPRGGDLFTGGPSCFELIRSINGVGGRILNIQAGRGVTITSLPAESKVIINVDLATLAVCAVANLEEGSSDCPPEQSYSDPCVCGPA